MTTVPRVRVLIVEDEAPARQRLESLIAELEWAELVGVAHDGRQGVEMVDSLEPDIVFLDIQLPELSGLDVLRTVKHKAIVVFTTAYDEYAVSAFELHAVDYLLKPFAAERFHAAAERARRVVGTVEDEPSVAERVATGTTEGPLVRIFVRDRGKITPMMVRDIERLEAEDDYVAVFARGRRHLVYLPLGEFEKRLDATQFLRIHRAHIVNLDFVSHLESFDGGRLQVTMRDGAKMLASRVRSKELRHLAL